MPKETYYRRISIGFWTDPKVDDSFTPEDKYFYLYLLTNPHTNICGCYEVSLKQMSRETGYNEDSLLRLLNRMEHEHGVIRYDSVTNEVLLLHWYKYNWSVSDKLGVGIEKALKFVKSAQFRQYIHTVCIQYVYGMDTSTRTSSVSVNNNNLTDNISESNSSEERLPKNDKGGEKRKEYGEYGWVRLTDEQYGKLVKELGEAEVQRCIQYVDESAQSNGNKNKWKDWNLVIRKCSREKWGVKNGFGGYGKTENSGNLKPDAPQNGNKWGNLNCIKL